MAQAKGIKLSKIEQFEGIIIHYFKKYLQVTKGVLRALKTSPWPKRQLSPQYFESINTSVINEYQRMPGPF